MLAEIARAQVEINVQGDHYDHDLTASVNRGAVRLNGAVERQAAWINFSFATGSVSMKVCIGVMP
jgi:hypothetical protein